MNISTLDRLKFEIINGVSIILNSPIRITTSDLIYNDEEFLHIYHKCKLYTQTSVERCYSLYLAAKYVSINKVLGDFVECGVWKGGSSMLAALTFRAIQDESRNIYLYDTFEGMPEPQDYDIQISDGKLASSFLKKMGRDNKWIYSPIEEVKSNIYSTGYDKEKLIFVKGKVEETIPSVIPQKISILRLDTDFYSSTKWELVHLFPLLQPGGVVIIDDYGHWAGSKKAVDEYFSENKVPILLNRIDYAGRIGVKSNK